MKHFDKMREKLRGDSALPEGLDWERMEAGIIEKQAQFDEDKTGFWQRFSISILVLIIGIGGVLYCWQDEYQIFSKKTLLEEVEISPDGKLGNQLNEKEGLALVQDSDLVVDKASDLEIANTSTIEKAPVSKQKSNAAKTILNKNETINVKIERNHKKGETSEKAIEGMTKGTKVSIFNTEYGSLNENNLLEESSREIVPSSALENNKPKSEILDFTSIKDLPVVGLSEITAKKTIDLPRIEVGKEGKPVKQDFLVAAFVGSNYWASSHFNTTEDEVSNTAILGYTLGLQGTYVMPNSFYITTGVQYEKLRSRLNATLISDSLVLTNALIAIEHDVFSGNFTEIYGDTLVNQTTTRTVQHFNAYSQFSIPLMVGYRFKHRRWDYYGGLGTAVHIARKAAGRSIMNEQVIDYNRVENKIGFSLQGELGMRYFIKDNLFLGASLNYAHHLKSWEIEGESDLTPRTFNINLSLGYTF